MSTILANEGPLRRLLGTRSGGIFSNTRWVIERVRVVSVRGAQVRKKRCGCGAIVAEAEPTNKDEKMASLDKLKTTLDNKESININQKNSQIIASLSGTDRRWSAPRCGPDSWRREEEQTRDLLTPQTSPYSFLIEDIG